MQAKLRRQVLETKRNKRSQKGCIPTHHELQREKTWSKISAGGRPTLLLNQDQMDNIQIKPKDSTLKRVGCIHITCAPTPRTMGEIKIPAGLMNANELTLDMLPISQTSIAHGIAGAEPCNQPTKLVVQ